MPPKKGKGAKGKGKKGAEKAAKAPVVNDAEQAAYRVAALEATVESLRDRLKVVGADNDDLRRTREKVEKDTHEFVAYFQKEMEKKDDVIADLKDTVRKLEREKEDDLRDMREEFESQIAHKDNEFANVERDLRLRLKTVEEELQVLFDFKAHKNELESQLREQAQNLVAKDVDHNKEMQNMERKFLEEKTRIAKEHQRNVARIKRQAREEAQKGLDADARRIVTDNRRMGEELRFQLQTTDELHELKEKLEEDNRKLQRDVALYEEKEKEYSKQGHKKGREIKDLNGQVQTLEKSLSQVVRDFEKQRAEMLAGFRDKTGELQVEVNGLRQLVKLKNKELRTIKRLAQTILSQRTEVEQFFLEALAQVKREISEDRVLHHRSASAEIRRQARGASAMGGSKSASVRFPPVRPEGSAGPQSARGAPSGEDKVDLKDLSALDRQRVLRLLFAKINNVSTFAAHPEHGLSASAGSVPETKYVDVPISMPGGTAGAGVGGDGSAEGEAAMRQTLAWAHDAAARGDGESDDGEGKVAVDGGGASSMGGALASMMGNFNPGTAPSSGMAEGALHGMSHTGALGVMAGPKSAPARGMDAQYDDEDDFGDQGFAGPIQVGVGGAVSTGGAAPVV